MASILVYSTSTNSVAMDQRQRPARTIEETWEDYCFICSRATDHVGEHLSMVEVVGQYVSERLDEESNVLYRHTTTYVDRAEGPIEREQAEMLAEHERFMASLG